MNETNLENRKVLACIEVTKRGREHALYFTKKKMVVAVTGISPLRMIAIMLPGILVTIALFGGLFVVATNPDYTLEPLWQVYLLGGIAVVLLFGPYNYIKWRHKTRIKEYFDAPETILMANKKNFEIAYDDITRIEMHPRWKKTRITIVTIPKITVLTNKEKHEFLISRKKRFNDYVNLIRSIFPDKLEILH